MRPHRLVHKCPTGAAYSHAVTQTATEQRSNGCSFQRELAIKTSKFAGHHQIRGTSAHLTLSECLKNELSVQIASVIGLPPPTAPDNCLCPRGHARSAFDQFDPHNVQKSVWCSMCTGAHASTAWTCPCNRAWHNCPDLFGLPLHAPQKPKTQTQGTKRQRVDTPQTSARKLSRLEPSVASRPILSPGLAKKFPHLVWQATVAGHNTHKG